MNRYPLRPELLHQERGFVDGALESNGGVVQGVIEIGVVQELSDRALAFGRQSGQTVDLLEGHRELVEDGDRALDQGVGIGVEVVGEFGEAIDR